MKKYLLLLLLLFSINTGFSQFIVTINEQKIVPNQRIEYWDLKTMNVSFLYTNKLNKETDGITSIVINLYGDRAEKLGSFSLQKIGKKSVDAFLYNDTTQFYTILPKLNESFFKCCEDKKQEVSTLLKQIAANKTAVVKVEMQLLFRTILLKDKNENILKYTEATPLLKDFIFYIDMID